MRDECRDNGFNAYSAGANDEDGNNLNMMNRTYIDIEIRL